MKSLTALILCLFVSACGTSDSLRLKNIEIVNAKGEVVLTMGTNEAGKGVIKVMNGEVPEIEIGGDKALVTIRDEKQSKVELGVFDNEYGMRTSTFRGVNSKYMHQGMTYLAADTPILELGAGPALEGVIKTYKDGNLGVCIDYDSDEAGQIFTYKKKVKHVGIMSTPGGRGCVTTYNDDGKEIVKLWSSISGGGYISVNDSASNELVRLAHSNAKGKTTGMALFFSGGSKTVEVGGGAGNGPGGTDSWGQIRTFVGGEELVKIGRQGTTEIKSGLLAINRIDDKGPKIFARIGAAGTTVRPKISLYDENRNNLVSIGTWNEGDSGYVMLHRRGGKAFALLRDNDARSGGMMCLYSRDREQVQLNARGQLGGPLFILRDQSGQGDAIAMFRAKDEPHLLLKGPSGRMELVDGNRKSSLTAEKFLMFGDRLASTVLVDNKIRALREELITKIESLDPTVEESGVVTED